MDDVLRKIAEQALRELPLTRLGDVARMIRPYKAYAHYGVLYQMAMEGDLPIVRDRRRRIWVIGEPPHHLSVLHRHADTVEKR